MEPLDFQITFCCANCEQAEKIKFFFYADKDLAWRVHVMKVDANGCDLNKQDMRLKDMPLTKAYDNEK